MNIKRSDVESSNYIFELIKQLDLTEKLMKQVFFGELTIKEREGAWEERAKERKEILEYRKQVEISKHEQKTEEARSASLDDKK